MRIALLTWESLHSIAVGGVAQHVTELGAALHRQGHDVHVFTRIGAGQADYARVDGVHYYRCPYKGHNEFVDDVNNMCRAFVQRLFGVEDSTGREFDIIHAHDWLTANALIWIKKGRLRRGVFTIHATEYARSGNLFHNGRSARVRDQERAGTYWADHVIAVSHTTQKELQWMYEVPDWKTSVVYNGVSRKRFDRAVNVELARRKYDIGPMDPVVLFCGRLDYQKGPDILLEAFPDVLRSYGNAKLIFAGDGGMRNNLDRRAHQLGVAHATRFLGYRDGDEIVDLFKLSDVVAAPSRNEPFGIVVLEAWCASKPVLVTHNGGPSEYVKHEHNGLRIYDNPHSVSWGIHRLFGDFEYARYLGANGRWAVDNGFTWDLVAELTLSVYDPDGMFAQRDAERAAMLAAETVDVVEECATALTLSTPARIDLSAITPLTSTEVNEAGNHGASKVNGTSNVSSNGETHVVGRISTDQVTRESVDVQVEVSLDAEQGDGSAPSADLRLCEQVLGQWPVRLQQHDGRLIVGGDWRTLFDALRDACRALHRDGQSEMHTRLMLAPAPGARSARRTALTSAREPQHENAADVEPTTNTPASIQNDGAARISASLQS